MTVDIDPQTSTTAATARQPAAHRSRYSDPDSPQSRFLEQVGDLRKALHRYCTRMTGSPLDGEDIVQDTLATAFFRLDLIDSDRPLRPLLFRIAHNRCIDWLRRRRFERPESHLGAGDDQTMDRYERSPDGSPGLEDQIVQSEGAAAALHRLAVDLPPRERSCVVLKDVLDYTLVEIAEIAGCSEGAVKSALHRGREKLAKSGLDTAPVAHRPADEETRAVLERYVDCFNRRDWGQLTELLADDVRLDVVGILEDGTREVILDRYTGNYSALEGQWRFELGELGGESVLLLLRRDDGPEARDERVAWAVRLRVEDGRVWQVRDYVFAEEEIGAALMGV